MLPGLFCLGLSRWARSTPFSRSRARPGLLCSPPLVVCVADPLIFLMLPKAGDASSLALAQSLAMALRLADACRLRPGQPGAMAARARAQFYGVWSLTAGMAALAAPWRESHPGLLQMIAQMAVSLGILRPGRRGSPISQACARPFSQRFCRFCAA